LFTSVFRIASLARRSSINVATSIILGKQADCNSRPFQQLLAPKEKGGLRAAFILCVATD
jgi:hypothetical protein